MNDAKISELRETFYEQVDSGSLSVVDALKLMRKIAGRSQADYAKATKVNHKVLVDFERGVGNPTFNSLQKLLAPFNLELTVRRKK